MAKIRASAAPFATKNTNLDDIRRSVTYHPSVWRDHFLSYTSDITEISAPENEQLETQRRKVNDHLTRVPQDSMLKMELIDAIQRLGVGYHFQKEIDDSLQKIRNTYQTELSKYNDDLHVVSLRFRLLRQQGYHVSCDVFNKFIDSEGNFKESLVDDVRGMLSLYEASNYGVLNGEEILDKALQFSSSNLKCFLPKMSTSVRRRVKDALEMPISKTLIRFGARKFISIYQEDESHNQDLLNFAKMDFNVVQKIHKKELNHITSWWKELDFANKLPFARDRVVEGYFWTVGVYFEPHYMIARRFLTKTIAMVSILDDIYDVHGTLDDLRRFTHSIPSWDITAFDELPPYMRLYYQGLLSVYAEMEEEMVKHGQSYRIQYAKQEMIKLSKAYMEEAEWCYSNYIPRLDEYIKVGVISSSHISLLTTSLIGIPDHITKHDFDWMANIPPIAWTSGLLGRLMDDLAGNGGEEKITAIECCMNENGWSRMEAFEHVRKLVKDAWRDMNEKWLEPTSATAPIRERILNITRVLCLMYAGDDGYTYANTRTKDYVKPLFVDPIN